MRNLYKRLGVPASASNEHINQAIIRCNDNSVKLDAEAVLLDPRAKKLYDQTQKTLKDISTLRRGMGLSHGSHWNSFFDGEFHEGLSYPLRAAAFVREKAGSSYPPKGTAKSVPTHSGRSFNNSTLVYFVIVAIVVLIVWSAVTDHSTPTYSKSPPSEEAPRPVVQFSEPPVQAPAHGAIARYHTSPGVAPLEIKTSYGDYYFVKMVNKYTGSTEIELFIHGGNRVEIEMPLGSYTMKYAVGKVWYSREYYFGPETAYSLAESTFNFTEDYRGYSGYTVTLYKVAQGNMETTKIPASAF